MSKALKVVGKIASVASVVLAFVPGGQPFAAAAAAISGVANSASQLLAPPQPQGRVSQVIIDSDAPGPYVMGRTFTAGAMVHDAGYGEEYRDIPNPNRSQMFVYSDCGPVEEIEGLYADGAFITSLGTAGGYYGEDLYFDKLPGGTPEIRALQGDRGAIPNWTGNHRLSGKACGSVTMRWDRKQQKWAGGVPSFGVIMKGVKVYSPRHDSTRLGGNGSCRAKDESTYIYSDNYSDHAVTYLLGRYAVHDGEDIKIFGVGKSEESIDWEAFIEWANVCDANGWAIGGVIFEPADRWNNLKLIMQGGCAEPAHNNGRLSVRFHSPKASVITLTEDDLAEGEIVTPGTQSFRDRINSVIPRYRSADHNWEYVPGTAVTVDSFVSFDGELKRREVQYSLVQDASHAASLAAYEVLNLRELKGITLPMKPVMIDYGPGETVELDMPNVGLIGKFTIVSRRYDPLSATFEVQFESETDTKHPFALGATTTPPEIPTLLFGEDLTRARLAFSGYNDLVRNLISTSWVEGLLITATTTAGVSDIDISSHFRRYSEDSLEIEAGSIEGLNPETFYAIYYDDPERLGEELTDDSDPPVVIGITYQVTENLAEAQNSTVNNGRHFVGYVTTPAIGAGPTQGIGATPPTQVPLSVPSAQDIGGISAQELTESLEASVTTQELQDALDQSNLAASDLVAAARADLEDADSAIQSAIIDVEEELGEIETAFNEADFILQQALDGLEGEFLPGGRIADLEEITTGPNGFALRLESIEFEFETAGGRVSLLEQADSESVLRIEDLEFEVNDAAGRVSTIEQATESTASRLSVISATNGPLNKSLGFFGEHVIWNNNGRESDPATTSDTYHPEVSFLNDADGRQIVMDGAERTVYLREPLPVDPSSPQIYTLSGEFISDRDSTSASNAQRALLITYGLNHEYKDAGTNAATVVLTEIISSDPDPVTGWTRFEWTFTDGPDDILGTNEYFGRDTDYDPSLIAFQRIAFQLNYNNGNGRMRARNFKLVNITDGHTNAAEITNLTDVVLGPDGHATRLEGIEFEFDNSGGRIATLETVSGESAQRLFDLEFEFEDNGSGRVSQLEEVTNEHSNRVSDIEFDFYNGNGRITTLESASSDSVQRISDIEFDFDNGNGRVSSLEFVTGNTASRLSDIEFEFNNGNGRVQTLESVTDNNASRLQDLEFDFDSSGGRIQTLESASSDYAGRISDIEFEFTNASGTVQASLTTLEGISLDVEGFLEANRSFLTNNNGHISGMVHRTVSSGNQVESDISFITDVFRLVPPTGGSALRPFVYDANVGTIFMDSAFIGDLSVTTLKLADNAVTLSNASFIAGQQNVAFNHSGNGALKTQILTISQALTGAPVNIDISAEFGVSNKGDVGGSSDNVSLANITIELHRDGAGKIGERKFGQYVLDSDNTDNELFDVLELANSLPIYDASPPAGNATYRVYARVDRQPISATVTGFVPVARNRLIRITELKK